MNTSTTPTIGGQPELTTAVNLLTLPAEIIQRVFCFLPLHDIQRLGSACRLLREHSVQDALWHGFVQENLHAPLHSPSPAESFRDLYLQHHSHWFLTRHALWYSDTGLAGKLVWVRLAENGCIEGYKIAASRKSNSQTLVPGEISVKFEVSKPDLKLDVACPILRLNPGDTDQMASFRGEKRMSIPSSSGHRVSSVFVRTQALSEMMKKRTSPASMWPPPHIPSPGDHRTLKHFAVSSRYSGRPPNSREPYSDATFWIRNWLYHETTQRVDQIVQTFATLPEKCYTPTADKPWQGIWSTDCGPNGIQFLLITQPDDPLPLPEHAQRAFETRELSTSQNSYGIVGMLAAPESDEEDAYDDEGALYGSRPAAQSTRAQQTVRPYVGPAHNDEAPYKGRLEAIKLTGDQNVPRGHYAFIAPDLGENGLAGYASESLFLERQTFVQAITNGGLYVNSTWENILPEALTAEFDGARIVRCVNHMSGVFTTDDKYEPTELVMISEDRLAQYSLVTSAVNFFQRVDLSELLSQS